MTTCRWPSQCPSHQMVKKTSNGDTTSTSPPTNTKQSPPVKTKKMPPTQTSSTSSRSLSGTTSIPSSSNSNKAAKVQQPVSKPKVVPAKDKEVDDIFASMGLSAKPTFQQKTNTAQQEQKPVKSYAADEESSLGSNSNWDDDDDLDDLLDD